MAYSYSFILLAFFICNASAQLYYPIVSINITLEALTYDYFTVYTTTPDLFMQLGSTCTGMTECSGVNVYVCNGNFTLNETTTLSNAGVFMYLSFLNNATTSNYYTWSATSPDVSDPTLCTTIEPIYVGSWLYNIQKGIMQAVILPKGFSNYPIVASVSIGTFYACCKTPSLILH